MFYARASSVSASRSSGKGSPYNFCRRIPDPGKRDYHGNPWKLAPGFRVLGV